MKKNKFLLFFSTTALVLVLITSVALSNNDFGVSQFFETKQQKLDQLKNPSNILVKSEKFEISLKDYVDYKENLAFVHEINNMDFNLKDEEIIQRMVDNKLLLDFATNRKVKVTEDEVKEYALQTKTALEQSASPEMHAIHEELAKNLSVGLDEYFTHPEVLKNYKEILMIEKAVNELEIEGKLNDQYEVKDFIQDLRKENKGSVKVSEQLLMK